MDDVEQLRVKLSKMTDRELREFANEARKLCKFPRTGYEPELEFVVRLEEATAEWRRRKNPKTTKDNSK